MPSVSTTGHRYLTTSRRRIGLSFWLAPTPGKIIDIKNPFRGRVFHDYEHQDVYSGVVIDYRGKDVNPKMFDKVMKGDKQLERQGKKVLKSGRDDNLFIYYTGHGAVQEISFPSGDLDAEDFNYLLMHLYSNYKYKRMVIYMDACYSGSIFQDILPSDVGIYVTTSARGKVSCAVFCDDKQINVCLATEYSYAWITDSQSKDIKTRTLDQQYEEVKERTKKSHVTRYGEMGVGSLPIGKFQGHYDLMRNRNDGTIALGHIVKETFHDLVMDVTTHYKPTVNEISKRDEISCFRAVFDQFRIHCSKITQVLEVAQQTTHLMELCKAGYDAETLMESLHNLCS